MYAMEPWSGNYTVPPAIWTSAHVNQFVEPGWHFLGGEGRGLLPGGGSWTVMVPSPAGEVEQSLDTTPRLVPDAGKGDFTLVLEKLEGDCLRCKVAATTAETVSFALTGALRATRSLSMWLTNGTVSFAKMADIDVSGGSFHVEVPRDTMITLSTTTGQAKGTTSPATCTGSCLPPVYTHALAAPCLEHHTHSNARVWVLDNMKMNDCMLRTGDVICSGVYKPFPFPFNASCKHHHESPFRFL